MDREFSPYYPSLIKWNKPNAGFTAPEVCAGCHPQQYEAWTGSVQALAIQSLEKTCVLKQVPPVPLVEMTVKNASF